MNPTVAKALHVALILLVAISGLGPVLASLAGLLPANVVRDISSVIVSAGALVAYLVQSPLTKPLLQFRPTAKTLILTAASTMFLLAVSVGTVACRPSLFGPITTSTSSDVGPVITCIGDLLDAGDAASLATIESAVGACGVAAADVDATVNAIEALVRADSGTPSPVAARILALPHRKAGAR